MPRTSITPQAATSAGLTPTFEPANVLGNSFSPGPGRALRVKNGSAGVITVTIPTPGTVDGLAIPDRAVSVPATTGDVTIGLGQATAYAQADGTVNVDYSAVTTVTVAVIDT